MRAQVRYGSPDLLDPLEEIAGAVVEGLAGQDELPPLPGSSLTVGPIGDETVKQRRQLGGIVVGDDGVAQRSLQAGDRITDDHRFAGQSVIEPIGPKAGRPHVRPVITENDPG